MPPALTRRGRVAQTASPGKKGRGALVVGGVVVAGGLLWWLLSRRRGGLPRPANPVVDVGDDQAVTLDATSHAQITIPFSVVADNPVNLVWTVTSGPAPVNFSPLSPNQELVQFQTPGTYFIRLTATDTTDSRAQGFDELGVIVNESLLAAILVPGELKVDGFASYTLTRDQGDTISFVWPVENVGNLAGAAFIQITEAGEVVGTGAPFPIDPGRTVDVNFNPVVTLALGVHTLVASVMQGLGPEGILIGSPQTITLTVVSIPVLSAVGLPKINNLDGPTFFTVKIRSVIPISWPCQNSGGGPGAARLRVAELAGFGGFIQIPGMSTVTLLFSYGAATVPRVTNYTLIMEDSAGVILGTWQYAVTTVL